MIIMCQRKCFIFSDGEAVEFKVKNKQKSALKVFQKALKLRLPHENFKKISGGDMPPGLIKPSLLNLLLPLVGTVLLHFITANFESFKALGFINRASQMH